MSPSRLFIRSLPGFFRCASHAYLTITSLPLALSCQSVPEFEHHLFSPINRGNAMLIATKPAPVARVHPLLSTIVRLVNVFPEGGRAGMYEPFQNRAALPLVRHVQGRLQPLTVRQRQGIRYNAAVVPIVSSSVHHVHQVGPHIGRPFAVLLGYRICLDAPPPACPYPVQG